MSTLANVNPPKCEDCETKQRVHPYRMSPDDDYPRFVWLCGSCKYKRDNPDALPYAPMPHERRAKPKQRETLF